MTARLKVRFGFGNKTSGWLSPRANRKSGQYDTPSLPESIEEVSSSPVFKKTTTTALKELLGDINIEAVYKGESESRTEGSISNEEPVPPSSAAGEIQGLISEPEATASSSSSSTQQTEPGKTGPVALYIRLMYTALRVAINTILRRLGLQSEEVSKGEGISIAEALVTPRQPDKIGMHSFNVEKVREALTDFYVALYHQYDVEKKILFCSLADKGIGMMHWQLLRDDLLAKLTAIGDLVEYCHHWRLHKHKLRKLGDEYKSLERLRPATPKPQLFQSGEVLPCLPASSIASMIGSGSGSGSMSVASVADKKRQTLPRSTTWAGAARANSAGAVVNNKHLRGVGVGGSGGGSGGSGGGGGGGGGGSGGVIGVGGNDGANQEDVEERLFWLHAEISEGQFQLMKLQHATRSIYRLRTQITQMFSMFSVEMVENLLEQERELLMLVQSSYTVAEECELLRKFLSISNCTQILRSTPWIIRHLPSPAEQSYFLRLMDSILPFRFYDVCLGLESLLPDDRKQHWERSLQIRLPRLSFVQLTTALSPLHFLDLFGTAILRGLSDTLDILTSSSPFRWGPLSELLDVFRIVPVYFMLKGMGVFPHIERRLAPTTAAAAVAEEEGTTARQWPPRFSPLPAAELPSAQQRNDAPPNVCTPFMHQHRLIFQHAKVAFAGLQQLRSEPSTLAGCIKAAQETFVLFVADQQLEKTVLSPLYEKHFSKTEQGSMIRECLGLPPFIFHDEMMPFIISRLEPDQRKDLIVCLALSLPKAQIKLYIKRISEKLTPEISASLEPFIQTLIPRRRKSSKSSKSSSSSKNHRHRSSKS